MSLNLFFHVAAVLVDDVDEFLRNTGGTVEHDRESRKALLHFLQNIKSELRLCAGFELVRAVAGSDRDCKGIASGLLDEFLNLLRLRVGRLSVFHLYIIFNAGERSEFCFDDYIMRMGIFVFIFSGLWGNRIGASFARRHTDPEKDNPYFCRIMATGDIRADGSIRHFNPDLPPEPTYSEDPATHIWKPNGSSELPLGAEKS